MRASPSTSDSTMKTSMSVVAAVASVAAMASAAARGDIVTDRLTLHEELGSVVFMQTDTARQTDKYAYGNVPVSYNEPDNVTCTVCQWSVHNGSWSYLFQEDAEGSAVLSPPLGIRSAPQLGGGALGRYGVGVGEGAVRSCLALPSLRCASLACRLLL